MSFVLKYGLSIALAMLLVGCPDDENEKEGDVKLVIKKIDDVAAGEGDNASVSVEVTIKDGDDKVTGDDAKVEVSLKHKCGSADTYSGSGKATAANAVAKPSIDVPRPAADAKDETHKCKIQASAKIGDKDVTGESNEFAVGKKDDSKSTSAGNEKANLAFGSGDLEAGPNAGKLMVGKEFTVTNSGNADGTVELTGCATGFSLVKVGDNVTDIDVVSGKATVAKKSGTADTSVKFAIVVIGSSNVTTCKLEGVNSADTDLVAQEGGNKITGIEVDGANLKIVYGTTAPEKLFVKKSSADNWVAAKALAADGHTFNDDDKGGTIAYTATANTAKALAKFSAGGWYYLADTQ